MNNMNKRIKNDISVSLENESYDNKDRILK